MSCFTAREPSADAIFVDGGLLVRGGAEEGRPVGTQGYRLTERPWQPGERIRAGGAEFVAPGRPACAAVWSRSLGSADSVVAGDGLPDTDLALSPDGTRLAVGTWRGAVLVLDAWTGELLAERTLAESLVRRVVWSVDGKTLFAAEQSSDALLHALDGASLGSRWTVRLADEVGSSPPPDGRDPWGTYQLPSAFGLEPLPDGSLLVAAGHGWPDEAGKRKNLGRLLRLGPGGERLAGWPAAAAAVIFQTLRVDGERALVSINHTADAPPPADLPHGGLVLLDVATLTEQRRLLLPPLGGLFPKVWMWEAVDLDGERTLVGLGDGRAQVIDAQGVARVEATPGTPITAQGVPIAASVGFGAFAQGQAWFVTSGTNIPWGAADPAARPPVPHPGASSVFVYGADGSLVRRWQGEQALEGLSVSPNGQWVVVGAGIRQGDDRRDLFGALRFSAAEPVFCRTGSPVFFRHRAADDGRVFVVEHPWSPGAGEVAGSWQVTLLR